MCMSIRDLKTYEVLKEENILRSAPRRLSAASLALASVSPALAAVSLALAAASDGFLLRHKKSGARVLLIENDDDNKVFSIGFRTPPSDSTGVPHIMEHSVLCGSKNFPPYIHASDSENPYHYSWLPDILSCPGMSSRSRTYSKRA